jgi:hypothetical protein
LRDIPADYYELSFWESIEEHLGLIELEFYAEFNSLLRSADANTIDEIYAAPGWKIPEGDIAEVVDFWVSAITGSQQHRGRLSSYLPITGIRK